MNTNFKNYYKNIILYDLLIKLNQQNIFKLPKITNIYLNMGLKDINNNKKKLINIILLLKLITNQFPKITKSKKNNVFLKIKKNSIVGCKLTLHNNNMNYFLEKLIFFILPNIEKNKFTIKNNKIFNFQISNILNFFELKTEFSKFKNLPTIDISIHTNSENYNHLFLLLNYLYIL